MSRGCSVLGDPLCVFRRVVYLLGRFGSLLLCFCARSGSYIPSLHGTTWQVRLGLYEI
jgi:hypothetical protein